MCMAVTRLIAVLVIQDITPSGSPEVIQPQHQSDCERQILMLSLELDVVTTASQAGRRQQEIDHGLVSAWQ